MTVLGRGFCSTWPHILPPGTEVKGDSYKCALVLCVQCTKNIKQNMSIATRLSVTAILGNCRMLFICDYVFTEHKHLDNEHFTLPHLFRAESADRNEIVLHGDTKFHFSIYPTESCIDYSWCCKDHWCWLHQLVKVGDAVYQMKQQINDQTWSINHTVHNSSGH